MSNIPNTSALTSQGTSGINGTDGDTARQFSTKYNTHYHPPVTLANLSAYNAWVAGPPVTGEEAVYAGALYKWDGAAAVRLGGSGSASIAHVLTMAAGGVYLQTHPSVSMDYLDDPDIDVSAWATYAAEVDQTLSFGNWNTNTDITIPNLNTSNVTWIDGVSADSGSFSAAKDAGVQRGCKVKINGIVYQIEAIIGDGTGVDDVVLSADPGGNYAIEWIHGVQGNFGGELTTSALGYWPVDYWYYFQTTATNSPSGHLVDVMTGAVGGSGTISGGGQAKMAISLDGGTTWKYFNGSAWATMTMAEWATKGLVIDNTFVVKDSAGAAMDGADWAALGQTPGSTYYLAIGLFVNTDAPVTINNTTLKYTSVETMRQLTTGLNYYSYTPEFLLSATRISETELLWKNGLSSALSKVVLKVKTP